MKTTLTASAYSNTYWREANRLPENEQSRYHLSIVYQYPEKIDIDKLAEALQFVVNTNYNLRSNFVEENGLKQIIHDHVKVTLKNYKSNTEKKYQSILDIHINKPFNLAKGPLFRFVTIYHPNDQTHTLLLVFHHAILGGLQANKLMQLIGERYHQINDLTKTDKEDIEHLKKYLFWEKEQIKEGDVSFWVKMLQPYPANNDLFHSHSDIENTKKGQLTNLFQLNPILYKKLIDLSKTSECSLFHILSTIWGILLSQYLNQNKVIISYPFNPIRKEYKDIKGSFTNLLFYTHENSGSFIESAKAKKLKFEKIQNYYIPSIDILSKLENDKNPFISVISPANLGQIGPKLTSIPTIPIPTTTLGAADLSLIYEDTGQSLNWVIGAFKDCSDVDFISRVNHHLHTLIEKITHDPYCGISTLSCLDEAEYKKVIHEWNHKQDVDISTKSLAILFEEQVNKTPNAIALVQGKRKITYQTLNQNANKLAHYLRGQGIVANTLVGLALERSIEFVIGLLAILKAGGAYVPLDPSYPKDRLLFIAKDTRISFLITDKKLRKLKGFSGRYFNFDTDWEKMTENQIQSNPLSLSKSDDLAYVIFTSGSTGKPKGVLQTHKTVTNLCQWENKTIQVSPLSKVTQLASIGFDVSIEETMYTLLNGFELHVISDAIKHSLDKLINYINQNAINRIFLPTALLQLFVEKSNRKKILLKKLQNITVSGEALKLTKSIYQFFERNSHISLTNEYGPTETHVATVNTLALKKKVGHSPLIGQPIMNMAAYILNDKLQPVPLNVIGELYLSGYGLAQGYLNQPELTEERFVKNPFVTLEQHKDYHRMYKTGDTVRWLPNGNIDYLGRNDSQVQFHGYRIELEEIENKLIDHPSIQQCVVELQERKSKKALVAFYSAKSTKQKMSDSELIKWLRKYLPAYMVPTLYVRLKELPRTLNGKIDRNVLAKYVIDFNKHYVAPRNFIERKLCAIWERILHEEKVGTNDDFFQLGGNSLMALSAIDQMQIILKKDIKLTDLFKYRTIKNIIKNTAKSTKKKMKSLVIPLTQKNTFTKLFLFHTARGSAEVYHNFSKKLKCSVYGVESYNIYSKRNSINNLKKLARVYAKEISKYIEKEDIIYVGGWSFGGILAYKVAEILKSTVSGIILFDTIHPALFSTIKMNDTEIEWQTKLSTYGIQNKESSQFLQKVLSAGSMHENIYRSSENNIKAVKTKTLLISASKIDPMYKQYKDSMLTNVSIWKNYLNNIEISFAKSSHEHLFDKSNLATLASKTNKFLKNTI